MTVAQVNNCQGCGEPDILTPGFVVRRIELVKEPMAVDYCRSCWDAVDGADPVTGAYGAAYVAIQRIPLT